MDLVKKKKNFPMSSTETDYSEETSDEKSSDTVYSQPFVDENMK